MLKDAHCCCIVCEEIGRRGLGWKDELTRILEELMEDPLQLLVVEKKGIIVMVVVIFLRFGNGNGIAKAP